MLHNSSYAGGGGSALPSYNGMRTWQGNFRAGLPADVTFTRASSGTYFDSSGNLQSAATDAARFSYRNGVALGLMMEGARTNAVRNSTMVGAGVGTAPTNWTANGAGAMNVFASYVGTGTENGMAYVDIRIVGTASADGGQSIDVDTTTGIAALNADVWTYSSYMKLVAGSMTGFTPTMQLSMRAAGGSALTSLTSGTKTITSTMQRFEFTGTLNNVLTAQLVPRWVFSFLNGAVVDATIRMYTPQAEKGTFSSSFIPTTTVAVTRAADVASITATKLGYNSVQGTILMEGQLRGTDTGTGQHFYNLNDTTATNNLNLYKGNGDGSISASLEGQATSLVGTAVINTPYKTALGYKTGSNMVICNGVQTGTSGFKTATIATTQTQLLFGNNAAGTRPLFGWIANLTYASVRFTDAELNSFTI